ncbi:hypothetical protein CRUP_026664 [Coryphaenoides rupestris]|nr:hypothetical protein CRUP_026664 [Coryphaenoides rupestris]
MIHITSPPPPPPPLRLSATFIEEHEINGSVHPSLSSLLPAASSSSSSSLLLRLRKDFGDGGAYPEIHVAQFPLEMGRKKKTSNALAVQVDAEGKIKYDAIARQGQGKDKVVFSKYTDLLPKEVLNDDAPELQRPDEEAVKEQGVAFNSGAKQRVIRMVEMQKDPMEPPRFNFLPAPIQLSQDQLEAEERLRAQTSYSTAVVSTRSEAPSYGHRQGWVPRSLEDFGDGGAYPEIHVAQFPLEMGRKKEDVNALAVQVDAEGKIKYDAIARQGQGKDKVVFSKYTDLLPKEVLNDDAPELQRPDEEAVKELTEKTRAALDKQVSQKIAAAMPQGVAFNSGAKQRVIRMVEMQKDPMEPPRFKINKKIPRGPPSPPAPVLHSPSRKMTVKEQQEWKIPPCISNWKNAKGYTIPLDKRPWRRRQEACRRAINENFAKLAEALYIADRKAREAVEMRAQVEKKMAQKEKEKNEENAPRAGPDGPRPQGRIKGVAFNSGAKQRVIRMVEMQKDPMEPPRFKINKKIPRGPPSPPAPVLHSPSRKMTVKEQQEWKIPPCISNWKNAKGYTIPLDKRLAADGRGLQTVHINENFAKLAEALYIADRKAREAVEMRAQVEKKMAQKEKEKKEEKLRELAQMARDRRAGIKGHGDKGGEDTEARERDEIRHDRRKERQHDRNISRAAPDKRYPGVVMARCTNTATNVLH